MPLHHLTFSSQNSPEISGLFREGRVVFNEAIKEPEAIIKTSEEEKKGEEKLLRERFSELRKGLKDKITDDIDTQEERGFLKEVLEQTTFALDGLKDSLSSKKDEAKKALDSLEDYELKNLEELEGVHNSLLGLTGEDVKYTEKTEKVSETANKSAVEIFLLTLPESFKGLTDKSKQSEIVNDSIKILNITETFIDTPLTKESGYSSDALVDTIYDKIIKSTNYNADIIERLKDNENKIEFKKWIANSISSEINELPSEKKDEKLYVSISLKDKITLKTQEDIDQEKKQEEALQKKEQGEVLTDTEAINAAMQEVKTAKIEFKNKFTGMGSMIAWIFNKFLGVDIKDPLASGGLVSIGRMMAGVDSPENTDKYDITKNPTLKNKFLTPKDIQRISVASVITPQAMNTIFSRKNIFSSEKVKKSVEETWTVGGKNGTGPKSKNLMGDVLRKFPDTEISKSSKSSVTFNFKTTKDIVQASALLQRQPSSMEMLNSVADGASEKISGLLGGLDLDISDMMDEPDESNPVIGNILDIQEAIGYPDITSVSQNGNKLTVSWDTTMADKIVDTVTGASKNKSSTISDSVKVGSVRQYFIK